MNNDPRVEKIRKAVFEVHTGVVEYHSQDSYPAADVLTLLGVLDEGTPSPLVLDNGCTHKMGNPPTPVVLTPDQSYCLKCLHVIQ